MSSDFNPYSEWLGLSPQIESPHYYELLGLPLNCDDDRQITAAADLAITKVRAVRPGSKAGEWADLLDMVYAAKDCLKDSARRAEYDQTLLAGKKSSASASKPTESGSAGGANIRPLATDNLYPPGMGPRVASASHVPHAPDVAAAQPAPSSSLPPMPPARVSADLPDPMRPVTAAAPAYVAPVAYGSAVPYGQQPPTGYLPPQPQYGQPAYGQQAYPAPAYGQPVYPAAAPYGSPMAPTGGYAPQGVPVGYAQPYGAPGQPYGVPAQPQPGPMDPMAPVAAASGYAAPAAVPMASLAPYAPPQAGGYGGGMPEPKSEGVAPAVSSSRASVLMARRERDAQGGLLVWGSIAGILIVGGVVVAAIMTNNTDRTGSAVVAQGEHANSTPTDVTKPAVEKQPSTPTPTPTSTPTPKPEPKPPKVKPKPPTTPTEMPAEDEPKGMPEKPTTEPPTPEKPTPESPTTPTPTPEPPPVPSTPSTPIPVAPGELPSRSDVVNLEKEIIDAKDAIGEQNFDIAQRHLESARKLAKLPQHKALISRLSLTADYVKQFRAAVEAALKKMDGGEAFNVGNTPVGFVEFTGKKAILRVAGQNKEYPLAELPPGLALAIANLHLSGEDPVSRVVKGAYLLMHHKTKSADLAKAREFWTEAAAGGVEMQDLMLLLDEKYELVKEFDKLATAAGSVTSTKPE